MGLKESGEMYLETILILSKKSSAVRSVDISEYMNFSKPSVSRAVTLLKNEKYIEINSGLITLTQKGRKTAEKIYERHNVLSEFLMRLGVDKETALLDACKMEHDISDTSFKAIKESLK